MKTEETLENIPSRDLTSDRLVSSHIDVIEAHLASGGEIPLSAFQSNQLDRLRFADEKIRQGHGRFKRDEVAQMIMVRYGVSRDTAYKYIVYAEKLFSSSYPLNKRYEIGIRIDFLKEKIRFASAESNWKAVAMMEKVLSGYYEQYPDIRRVDTKKKIVLNVLQQFFAPEGAAMSLDDAIQQAEIVESEDNDIE